MEDQKIKEILIEKNQDFRQLFLAHQQYEDDLLRLQSAPAAAESAEALTTATDIKKQKLKLKDAMQQMISDFKKNLG